MQKRNAKGRSRLIAVLLTLVVVAAAVLAFLYRDELFGRGNLPGADPVFNSEPYTYEYGAKAQFALMGEMLAVSSSTGLQVLDNHGLTLERQVFAMRNPALSANDKLCAFYDVGGTVLRVYNQGELINLDAEDSIISVSLSDSGYIAVCREESGYKGTVVVYDGEGRDIYEYDSGSGYVLDAALSPDAYTLAVLTLEPEGSRLRLFELDSEEEKGSVSIPGDVAFDVSFTSNNSLCAVSGDAIRFYGTDAGELDAFGFDGLRLTGYFLGKSFCVVSLSKYVSGAGESLTTLESSGGVLGTTELAYSPVSLYISGESLMVFGGGSVSVFSGDLGRVTERDVPAGYNSAVYLPNGDLLLLSSYHGEKIPMS
jgi:hypothetical protein